MSDLTLTFIILAAAVAAFVSNRIPPGIVALGVAVSLWATGVLPLDQVFAGFGSTTVVLIASLFVVAEGLDAAGVTTWAGQVVMRHAGESRARLIVVTMLTGALLSALITPNGAAAALIPMVVVVTVRIGMRPSGLLMPLAYSAHAGSLLMLTGTPINVLILEASASVGERELRFFEFARVGIPLLLGTILIVVVLGSRLLPDRDAKSLPRDLSGLPTDLMRQYIAGQEFIRLRVMPGSSLIGQTDRELDLTTYDDLVLIGAQTDQAVPLPGTALTAGMVLVVRGPRDVIYRFAADADLTVISEPDPAGPGSAVVSRYFGVAEVIIPPRSPYIGERAFPGMVTDSGSLVILSILRDGVEYEGGETVLEAGDSMLLQGSWDALDEHTRDPNVILVDAPDAIRRQTAPLGSRAVTALAVMAVMVVLLATGAIPAAVAALGAAVAMVLLRVVSVEQAHRSLSWTTLILVAGMIPLSVAITETGAADLLATGIVDLVGGAGPYALLLGLFLITAVLGQVISNTATALILIPIALSVATEAAISPMPLLMCVNVAAAAALLTPIATPANLMVMGPAGYRFGDYVKLGLPVMGLYLLVAVFLVPFWWPW